MKLLLKKIYSKIGSRLRKALHITEMQSRLDEVNHRAFLLQQEVEKLEKVVGTTNVLLSGINTSTHSLHDESHGGSYEMYDIFEAINSREDDSVSMNTILEYIEKHYPYGQNSYAIVGTATHSLPHILQKKGVKKITNIRCRSLVGTKHQSQGLMAYPLELHTISLPLTDVLLFPNSAIGSLAVNHAMFGYGTKIRKAVILVAYVMNDSIFSSENKEKTFVINDRLVYNDNYIRQQIHASGFSDVRCIYTSGENINHSFDEKVSHFTYKTSSESEYEVIKDSNSYHTMAVYNTHIPVKKIYLGTKLPVSNRT